MVKRIAHLYGVVLSAAVVAAALLAPAAAGARVGTPEPGFGDGRRVALDGLNPPFQMDVSADGSVTILNEDAVSRFLPDGQLDPGFGEGGRSTLDPEIEGLPFEHSGIAVDGRGRVLVFGTVSDPTQIPHARGRIRIRAGGLGGRRAAERRRPARYELRRRQGIRT